MTALDAIDAVLSHSTHSELIVFTASSCTSSDDGVAAEALVSAAQRRFEQKLVRARLQYDQQYVSRSLSLSAVSSSLRSVGTHHVGDVVSCVDAAVNSLGNAHIAVDVDVERAESLIALIRGASPDADNIRSANDSFSRLNIARCRQRIASCVSAIDERTRDVGAAHTRLLDVTAMLDAAITSV